MQMSHAKFLCRFLCRKLTRKNKRYSTALCQKIRIKSNSTHKKFRTPWPTGSRAADSAADLSIHNKLQISYTHARKLAYKM
jgi:hypothetical protein